MTGAGTTQACAACKYQRRKCAPDCPLAPYFPPDQPKRFQNVHRLFGVSNILRILKLVEPSKREDAVKSIVYEADTREKDAVHGCLGVITLLQSQIVKLKEELAYAREQLYVLQQQHHHPAYVQQQLAVHAQQQALAAAAGHGHALQLAGMASGQGSLGGAGAHFIGLAQQPSYSVSVVSPRGSSIAGHSHYDAACIPTGHYRAGGAGSYAVADTMRHNFSSFMDYRPSGYGAVSFNAAYLQHGAAQDSSAGPSLSCNSYQLDSRPSPTTNSYIESRAPNRPGPASTSYLDCGRPFLQDSCRPIYSYIDSRPSLGAASTSYMDNRASPDYDSRSSCSEYDSRSVSSMHAAPAARHGELPSPECSPDDA